MQEPSAVFDQTISDHLKVIEMMRLQTAVLEQIAIRMRNAISAGKKILWFGNGGSAADAQHLAAELVGRFLLERRGLPSLALTTNSSVVTAISNDYGYEHVFRRQIEALCVDGDVAVGISTSGSSRNVCLAVEAARAIGAYTVAFTGKKGGSLASIADAILQVPSLETPRIQEAHILCGHMLCDFIERSLIRTSRG